MSCLKQLNRSSIISIKLVVHYILDVTNKSSLSYEEIFNWLKLGLTIICISVICVNKLL